MHLPYGEQAWLKGEHSIILSQTNTGDAEENNPIERGIFDELIKEKKQQSVLSLLMLLLCWTKQKFDFYWKILTVNDTKHVL